METVLTLLLVMEAMLSAPVFAQLKGPAKALHEIKQKASCQGLAGLQASVPSPPHPASGRECGEEGVLFQRLGDGPLRVEPLKNAWRKTAGCNDPDKGSAPPASALPLVTALK